MIPHVEPSLTINITQGDLEILIKESISEYMLEKLGKSKKCRAGLLTHAEVLKMFYIKPSRLLEWQAAGIITEYRIGGGQIRFSMGELMEALRSLHAEFKKLSESKNQKEAGNE